MSDVVQYRSRPFVCGAIGRWDTRMMRRLVQAGPDGLVTAIDVPGAVLLASGELDTWSSEAQRGVFWSSFSSGDMPTSWQSASELRLAGGLVVGDEGPVLHNDALGLGEIYVRSLDGGLYFAARIDPLLTLDDRKLHVDWAAWASTLSLGSPVGDATPFAEIRRIEAASAWTPSGRGHRHLRFEPSFIAASSEGRALEPAELAERIRPRIPRPSPLGRVHLTFSGGWDSRLLAGLAASVPRGRVRAWTTSPDDGLDLDVVLSRPVAEALDLHQEVLVPGPDAWAEEVDVVRARVQYQTWMHTWLMPLARRLHEERGPVLDGLAGDVLLKSLFVNQRILAGASSAEQRARLWSALGGARLGKGELITSTASRAVGELSWQSFDGATQHVKGHEMALCLSVLLTRTTRAVAASPLLLFGPECNVSLPFVHPDVMTEALRIPVRSKLGGEYYRRLLESVCGPVVADLRSTNDPRPTMERGQRRQARRGAVTRLLSEIREDDVVRPMLGTALRELTGTSSDLAAVRSQDSRLAALQALGLLASWRSTYAERLVSEASPF
ncbi:MAG: hypothetical protein ABWX84_09240 [Nocardioides sp.]